MWCRHCKQDVPAVAPAADGAVHCARCQATLDRPAFVEAVNDSGVGLDQESQRVIDPLGSIDRFDAQQRRQVIRRSIRAAQSTASAAPRSLRFDPPEPLVATHTPVETKESIQQAPAPIQPARTHAPSQGIAWLLALLGAMTLGAGVGLMFWSISGARPELWQWGLGATLSGQGLMIVGLIQLLASLWGVNRESAGALHGVQTELRRLQRTTESLVGSDSPSAANFYADIARGASPTVLLANLKSQVDALSAHVAQK